ncbi:phytoene/squalene synthase family protein [Mycetocola sp.]|uniref:phytoene/squalene synthase family protein n=1 Tax=Mycetocola sp. TaxID=1871042 RepID=UPI003988DC14
MKARKPVASSDLSLYSRVAHRSSSRIIRDYSTSFRMASGLLSGDVRKRVEDIYALVRVADEVVDGAAEQAGLGLDRQRSLLDALEAETNAALEDGYSTNLVVHAFAITARESGFGVDLTAPFFASMRRDLSTVDFTEAELREYIYGSAEVVGLMCLRVFLRGRPVEDSQRLRLEAGARRLGSAFQKINFLRDLATDWSTLGRSYFPGIDPGHLTEEQKLALVADIQADLDAAGSVIPELPANCRRAVAAAHGLFSVLTARVRATPADELLSARVRVPTRTKLAVLARTMLPARPL